MTAPRVEAPEPPAFDPLTAPLDLLVPVTAAPRTAASRPAATQPAADATWPCGTCETANPLDAAVCNACGAGFLDVVRLAEPPLMSLPFVGDISRLTKGQLLSLAFAVVTAVLAVTLLVGVLLS